MNTYITLLQEQGANAYGACQQYYKIEESEMKMDLFVEHQVKIAFFGEDYRELDNMNKNGVDHNAVPSELIVIHQESGVRINVNLRHWVAAFEK